MGTLKKINMTVNGEAVTIETDPLRRLLDVLREDLEWTGVKEGCGEGECGSCSVIKNELLVNSCMVAVGTCEGADIVTPEGLAETDHGKTIINAYGDSGAVQCGFCTPGMMVATEVLLRKNPNPNEAAAREGLAGNLCRCTGYDMIVEGVLLAAERGKGLW